MIDASRILSLDSGNLYGLFSVLMLRDICRKQPNFLSNIYLLAGTGSGALNTLILAKYENPRDGIDELVSFWKEPQLFWNSNPWAFWSSFFGLSSWYGTQDYLSVVSRYFSGLTLGDLNQRVLITFFDWAGDPKLPPQERSWKIKVYYNFPDDEPDRDISLMEV